MTKNISVIEGDITKLNIDAIVNAANNSLCGGGGVDGAIHRAAGPELLELCRTLNGCETGRAKITPGFNLPARYIIHAVGPVWYGGSKNEDNLLASCYQECLRLAQAHGVNSIAFPAISCGSYRFPIEQACKIALHEVSIFLNATDSKLSVTFVAFEKKILTCFNRLLNRT